VFISESEMEMAELEYVTLNGMIQEVSPTKKGK
jgi:hypothetical protein